ncbi:hypothetical protein EIP91_003627 [Steccherinum ochraceum]|uniref:BTB domain-containing protein n=1 Tax=Steccherinum ochraceum TaxID=92696 RepID=A0A4R0RA72_9APHY|nr:hypothetical protein EIP91_003627 [Steccherinum ochraceum]
MDTEDFGQSVRPTAAIRNILDSYPFSIGILRELLQNSDDAKASRQVFLLDSRTHSQDALISDALGIAQGPALLAYNDSTFKVDDWTALQHINESSKREDTSKIGKYGIGFRSCYHMTDTPQIMSDKFLAVFDPHHTFTKYGGTRVDIALRHTSYSSHVQAMNLGTLDPTFVPGDRFNGTVIRLPLRQDASKSEISAKTLTSLEIRKLLVDFVQGELPVALLFLSHLKSITLMEVDDSGVVRTIGAANLTRTTSPSVSFGTRQQTAVVTHTAQGRAESTQQTWRIFLTDFPSEECARSLSQRLKRDATSDLRREKLSASVSLAFPDPLQSSIRGRLFTFLPLPLPTGFPCHVHALFALTPSRQNLRNSGETGIVPGARDELLIEWNKLLFDEFIPRAWGASLEVQAGSLPESSNIWHAWPPESQNTPGGDSAYWRYLVSKLVQTLVDERRAVFPLAGAHGVVPLNAQDLLINSSQQPEQLALALSAGGVPIATVPLYIAQTIASSGRAWADLTPQNARAFLTRNEGDVTALSAGDKGLIRDFLLTTEDAALVEGIPVIPLADGGFVALRNRTLRSVPSYTFVGDQESNVFRACAGQLVPTAHLPTTFISSASASLNVGPLACEKVVECLKVITEQTPDLVWLQQFWSWLMTWALRDQLYPSLLSFALVPDSSLGLHTLMSTLFKTSVVQEATRVVLDRLGLRFLHPSFPTEASRFLEQKGHLRSPTDISALLQHCQTRPTQGLPTDAVVILAQHVNYCLGLARWQVSDTQRSQLRKLPVFPLLLSSQSTPHRTEVPTFSLVQQGSQLVVIDTANLVILKPDATSVLLPVVPNAVFVARSYKSIDASNLAACADPSLKQMLSEAEIISFAITHFTSQTKAFQAAFLHQIASHSKHIPPNLVHSLSTCSFVAVQRGNLKTPGDVVDPASGIASLFDVGDSRLPNTLDANDKAIIDSLRRLHLLRTTLDDDIVRERLVTIDRSRSSRQRAAGLLLQLLNTTNYDCSRLTAELQLCWLPTDAGLRYPTDCRDQTRRFPRGLFDHALDVLAGVTEVQSPTLRAALKWDVPVSLDVIRRQLDGVLRRAQPSERVGQVCAVLIELGQRLGDMSAEIATEFRRVVEPHSWVPTLDWSLCASSRALLNGPGDRLLPGFHSVAPKLFAYEGVHDVLKLLGCQQTPTNSALLEELHTLGSEPLSTTAVKNALRLLKALDTTTFSESDRQQVLIPDTQRVLRPISQIYIDDLGARAFQVELPTDRSKAHVDMRSTLASKLGVHTLSSLELKRVELDDEGMHEDLTTRISNVLRQYSISQTANEFLANAADAGADEFNIMVDTRYHRSEQIMSPHMAPFQNSAAVVLHNNAVFKQEDWKGIRRVGLGGKQGHEDSIGRFGLGALAMFHFTEMAMIVSGDFLMFLDPSQRYLPTDGPALRNTLLVPIAHMRSNFPDHLDTIHGLHGFDSRSDHYSGTIFRLPLRSTQQASQSKLIRQEVTSETALRLFKEYGASAPHALLNIDVCSMSFLVGNLTGTRVLWSVKSTRQAMEQRDDVSTQYVTMEYNRHGAPQTAETWYSVCQRSAPPAEFQELTGKHRLRKLVSTISGLIRSAAEHGSSTAPPRGRLYSRLPLPILTSLPIHIDAPFVLADDRRTIRFEEGGHGGLESQYNHWLLSVHVTQLYKSLLEKWPGEQNGDLWPGVSTSLTQSDPMSRAVINGFYGERFMSSSQRFCDSMSRERLSPSESLFLGSEPSSVKTILRHLQPSSFVQLPSRARAFLPEDVSWVDASAIRDIIAGGVGAFQSLYLQKVIHAASIDVLILRMLNDLPDSVLGLAIIPLADGKCFGAVEKGPLAPVLYTGSWTESERPWRSGIFPAHRFLHPDIKECGEALVALQCNVRVFGGQEAVSAIQETIPAADSSVLSRHQQDWLAQFWRDHGLHELGIELSSLDATPGARSIPFIPTTKPNTFVSLQHACNSPEALALPPQGFLRRMLERSNAIMVDKSEKSACHPSLRLHLDITCTFEDVLQLFGQRGIPDSFAEPADHARFAEFARAGLDSVRKPHYTTHGNGRNRRQEVTYTIEHLNIVRQLPIWFALRNGQNTFVSADSAFHMLPLAISTATVADFLGSGDTYVDYDTRLSTYLGAQAVSLSVLCSSLQFPSIMNNGQVANLQAVLRALLTLGSENIPNFNLPDTDGRVVSSSTLYAHSNPVFGPAFESQPHRFLHPGLRSLEPSLSHFGFNYAMTLDAFRECAIAVHQNADQPRNVERAHVVFAYYNDNLWSLATGAGNGAASWNAVDNLSFIPRSRVRRNYPNGLDHSFFDYACELPDIVTPSQILRPAHEAIAWTQRVLPSAPLSDRLLIANTALGVPGVDEVVEHLLCLKMIADRYPHNTNLISDLTETYTWLNAHTEECRGIILGHRDKQLFLNVDYPSLTWTFASANQLIFNGLDEGSRQCVRSYLLPFKKLLLASGAREVTDVVRPALPLSAAEEDLGQWRSTFNQYRLTGEFTDNTLQSSDGLRFPVHRLILASESSYFRSKFSGRWKVGDTVPLNDVSGANLDRVLDFVYVRKVPFIEADKQELLLHQEELLKLLSISHYWSIRKLFQLIENLLIDTISIGTYESLGDAAATYGDDAKALTDACAEWRARNAHVLLS